MRSLRLRLSAAFLLMCRPDAHQCTGRVNESQPGEVPRAAYGVTRKGDTMPEAIPAGRVHAVRGAVVDVHYATGVLPALHEALPL